MGFSGAMRNPLFYEPTRPHSPKINKVAGRVSLEHHLTTPEHRAATGVVDVDVALRPRLLSRSQTMSFIPRPKRGASQSSVIESEWGNTPRPTNVAIEKEVLAIPSRIPSPVPRAISQRQTSPRRHYPNFTIQQEKRVAASDAFTGVTHNPSPSQVSVRSYTTPNLVRGTHLSPTTQVMDARKAGSRRPSNNIKKADMKENATPTTQRYNKRPSQIQEKPLKSESLMAPTVASQRRSIGPANAPTHGKQRNRTTSSTATKRLSSHVTCQDPLTVQRALPKRQTSGDYASPPSTASGSIVTHNHLLRPVSPPVLSSSDHVTAIPPLPRANTQKDIRKQSFLTPYKRGGGGVLSRLQDAANDEVSLPRFSSFHNPPREAITSFPSVPPIPEKWKSVSMPLIVPVPVSNTQSLSKEEENCKRKFAQVKSGRNSGFCEENDPTVIPKMCVLDAGEGEGSGEENPVRPVPKTVAPRKLKTKINTQPTAFHHSFSTPSIFSRDSSIFPRTLILPNNAANAPLPPRPQAFSPSFTHGADITACPQVKEYMPSLYWAGRFQTRFDQWRTQAMRFELEPEYDGEGEDDPLAQCRLSQDKVAACHIFLQLRNCCLSVKAADSLWVGSSFFYSPLRSFRCCVSFCRGALLC